MADAGVVCCIRCGHDTSAKSGICSRCTGVSYCSKFATMRGETNCRTIDQLRQDEEPEEETSWSRYHGDNLRDDT